MLRASPMWGIVSGSFRRTFCGERLGSWRGIRTLPPPKGPRVAESSGDGRHARFVSVTLRGPRARRPISAHGRSSATSRIRRAQTMDVEEAMVRRRPAGRATRPLRWAVWGRCRQSAAVVCQSPDATPRTEDEPSACESDSLADAGAIVSVAAAVCSRVCAFAAGEPLKVAVANVKVLWCMDCCACFRCVFARQHTLNHFSA